MSSESERNITTHDPEKLWFLVQVVLKLKYNSLPSARTQDRYFSIDKTKQKKETIQKYGEVPFPRSVFLFCHWTRSASCCWHMVYSHLPDVTAFSSTEMMGDGELSST